MKQEIKELIKLREAANLLKVSIPTVRNYIRDGHLTKIQPVRTILLDKKEVLSFGKLQ